MNKNVKETENKKAISEKNTPLFPKTYEEAIQDIAEMREYWRVNQRHCDPTCPEARANLINNNITFDPTWLGETGCIRFILFLLYNHYEAGKTELERKSKNEGFSPSNCRVILKKPKSPKTPKTPKSNKDADILKEQKVDVIQPEMNITNNFVMVSEDFKLQVAQEVLKAMGISNVLVNKQNGLICLTTVKENHK